MSPNESHDNIARFHFETLDIPGGWSASVLTDRRLAGNPATASSSQPALDDWRRMLSTLVSRPDTLPERIDLKHSHTAQVFRTRVSELDVVCKHGAARPWWQGLRASRERKNWTRAFALLRAGIRTPLPRALLERRRPAEAWLVVETIPHAIDLDGVMWWQVPTLPTRQCGRAKRALGMGVAELCARMRSRGVYHRDFKASNIMVTDWDHPDGHPLLWLVDLDGVRLRHRLTDRAHWRAVARVAASLVACSSITLTDRARFVRALSSTVANGDWKTVWHRLEYDVTRYNRLARTRKQGKLDGFLSE